MRELKIFLGQIGSGKDYSANLLGDYAHISLADPIRELAWALLGWKPKDFEEYEKFKEGKTYVPNFGFVVGRIFLQNLGSELRKRNENYWCEQWSQSISNETQEKMVCSDCRFPNEVWVSMRLPEDINVEFIWCCYESQKFLTNRNDKHETEKFAKFLSTRGLQHGEVIIRPKMVEYLLEYKKLIGE